RRRHTIFSRDWSSDVCSSDLGTIEFQLKAWRTENGSGCSADHVYVVDGSWILTPEFTLIPTCPEPTDLSYANPTLDSVDLMWTRSEERRVGKECRSQR